MTLNPMAGDGGYPGALDARLGDRLGPAVSFATTEHFNLQTARTATVAEANGRANIYLAALSSSLIALAFIGQMSRVGTAFYTFALVLLPVLGFIGVVTFQRLVQSSMEDIAYARRMARVRAFYLDVAPELGSYLLSLPELAEPRPAHHASPSGWQLALTTAGMVAIVNGAVLGAAGGLAVAAVAESSLVPAVATGVATGALAVVAHAGHQRRARRAFTPLGVDQFAIATASVPEPVS
jgi:hypothetical protein